MSYTPEQSSIQVDGALEEKLKGASFEEIKAHMTNAAVEQRLVVPDRYDPSILLPVEPGTAPRKFAQTITNDKGQKLFFYGSSELELEQNVGAYFRSLAEQLAATPQQTQTEQPRNERGQFTAAETAAETERQAALSLRLQLGQIDISTYLEESGAVGDYLAKQGIDLEDLKSASQEKHEAQAVSSWEAATERFIANHPDWQGGDENRDLLGKLLLDNNLTDAADKLAATEACYRHAVENGMLTQNPEVTARERIGSAKSVEEIREAVGYKNSTGLWGR